MPVTFESDFKKLKHFDSKIFKLSKEFKPEILIAGKRYEELYPYFWQLIDENIGKCQECQIGAECYNRLFLSKLKAKNLSRNDLYLLAYMTTYFLDLIKSKGVDLSTAYYILSLGHDSVIKWILASNSSAVFKIPVCIDPYQGYLLGVLYYLLPDFEYKISVN